MKKYFAVVILVLGLLPTWSQGNPANIPLLMTQLQQNKPDTQLIRIYIKLAECYIVPGRCPNRIDSAAFYLEKATELNKVFKIPGLQNQIDLVAARQHCILFSSDDARDVFLPVINTCKKTGDKLTEAQAWMLLGSMIEEDMPSNSFKLSCYENALALTNQTGDTHTGLKLQGLIAYTHVLQNKFTLAEQELLFVLQRAQNSDPIITMYTYDELTFLYIGNGELNKALQYALKTEQMMGVSGDSTNAYEFYHRLTSIYGALLKFSDRDEWGKKMLEFKMATDNIPGVFSNINVLGDLMRLDGNPGEVLGFILNKLRTQKPNGINDQRIVQEALGDAYKYQKMYELAERSYLEMIRLGQQQTHNFSIADKGFENYKIGQFYFDRGIYQKARYFFEESVKNYEVYGVLTYSRYNYLLLFRTDSALGNYMDAIRSLKKYYQIGDTIFNTGRNSQVEELQVAYHTEQKDKSIKLLNEKEKMDQVLLQNTRSTRNWIIAVAFMLLIIAGLLYRQTIMRKKNNLTINDKNKQLQHLVTEKEWLLKEVHHRVKNNLHTVISLLESQAVYLEDDALQANEISKHRIYAMSLIHQQLYKGEDIKTIDMAVFLPELLDYLSESFGTEKKIRFHRDIASTKLGVSQAIPVALIVNEAVTNSIKYAFTPGQQGVISIRMFQSAEKINLVIADNGKGIDPSIIHARTTSMGLNLMKGLTGEMEGEISIVNENGTKITISFGVDQLLTH